MLVDTSIARKRAVTMDELKELEEACGISIRAVIEERWNKSQRQGGVRPDYTGYSVEAMIKGIWGEFAGVEMFGERIDLNYYEFGDHCDFTKPLPWDNRGITRFDIKVSNSGELIVNASVVGKADVYILVSGDIKEGFRLVGWMTAPDMRAIPTERRQGPAPKHVCSADDLRSIDELWKFIDEKRRITNRIQKGSTW